MTSRISALLRLAVTLSLLPLAIEASIDQLKKHAGSHDVVAATRGLIHRRVGPRYNDQVGTAT